MNQKYESQMKKGMLDMLVLKLLEKEPKYGYQIISELREKSGDRFVLKEGTLYPILYRLEDDGLILSQWQQSSGEKGTQKILSDHGRRKIFPAGNLHPVERTQQRCRTDYGGQGQ